MELVVQFKGSYTGSDGKEHQHKNFYLKLDNGYLVAIKPCFKSGYNALYLVAKRED